MKKIIFIFVLSLFTTAIFAQSDSSKLASKNMIGFKRNFWTGPKFYSDDKWISRAEINEKLMNSPASANEFNFYRKDRNFETYSGIAAIAFLMAPLIANNFKTVNSTAGKVSLGIGYGMIIPLIIFRSKSNKHFGKAFNAYNQQFR